MSLCQGNASSLAANYFPSHENENGPLEQHKTYVAAQLKHNRSIQSISMSKNPSSENGMKSVSITQNRMLNGQYVFDLNGVRWSAAE